MAMKVEEATAIMRATAYGAPSRYGRARGTWTVAAFDEKDRLISVRSSLPEDEAQATAAWYESRDDVSRVKVTEVS